jgi:hypothetical protein
VSSPAAEARQRDDGRLPARIIAYVHSPPAPVAATIGAAEGSAGLDPGGTLLALRVRRK